MYHFKKSRNKCERAHKSRHSLSLPHIEISASFLKKYAIRLPSVSFNSGQINIFIAFPDCYIAWLLAITNMAQLLAMGCLYAVHVISASFIYFGGTMNMKRLCWTLTWCLQRQMSIAIKRADGGGGDVGCYYSHWKFLSSEFDLYSRIAISFSFFRNTKRREWEERT